MDLSILTLPPYAPFGLENDDTLIKTGDINVNEGLISSFSFIMFLSACFDAISFQTHSSTMYKV